MQAAVNAVLVLVQAMFASIAIVGKLVFPTLPPRGLVVFRVAGAALILWLVAGLLGRAKVSRRSDWWMLALLGGLGVVANQNLFLMGLERTTAINASLLVTTVPVFTVLYSVLGGQERASPPKIAGIALAGLGVVYLIGPERVSLAPDLAIGNGLVVLAMMCYSGFLVLSKPALKRYGTLTVVLWAMTFGALGTLPLGLPSLQGVDWAGAPMSVWGWVVYIVLVPTLGAFSLSAWALRRTSSHLVAAYIYLQPLITASVAPAVLEGEQLTPRTLTAAAAIFGGLGLVIWAESKRQAAGPVDVPWEE